MNHPFHKTLVCALIALGCGPGAAALAAQATTEQALLAEVKQHPLAKLGPWLINLHEEYRQFASSGGRKSRNDFRSSNPLLKVTDGFVAVEGVARDPDALRLTLEAIGATDLRTGILFSARVPVDQLDRLARDPALKSAGPVLAKTRAALPVPAVSQGVRSLFGDGGNASGFDGSGVRIGALSDSYGCEPPPFLPGAPTSTVEEDVANGELPADVVVAEDVCPGIDEGRAMLQLIHDVAPGASLAFHTAFISRFDFACGILELAGIDTAGAASACTTFGVPYAPQMGDAASDVVVDDVIYFAEPMFMPGAVAQAANTVAAANVPYFSSAGNNERLSYEAPYDEVIDQGNFGNNLNRGNAPGPRAIRVHEFADGDTTQSIRLTQAGGSATLVVSFQWDQPHFSSAAFNTLLAGGSIQDALTAPGATTDLDIVFYDDKGILVPLCPPGVAVGITCQITGDDNLLSGDAVDLAALFLTGPRTQADFQIRIVRSGGEADLSTVKYVRFDLAGVSEVLEHDTRSGTSYGHSNAAAAASIGAAAWYATVEWADNPADERGLFRNPDGSPRCDPACAEDFSSAGGVPLFFDAVGNRLAVPVVPDNPWVTGPDGGNTTFFISDSSFDDDDGDGFNNPFSAFLTPPDPEPASEYPNFFGTSASAPHVAAVAGLMLQKNPSLTTPEVLGILRDTAEDMTLRFVNVVGPGGPETIVFPVEDPDPEGFDYDTGHGFVDAAAAVEATPEGS